MNEADIRLFGKLFSELRDLDQRRTEIFDEFLTEIGRPFTETPTKTEKPTQEAFSSLKSTEKVSSKGPYRLIIKAENPDNPAFEKLRSYIKQKNGFCQLHGFKAWIFSNDPENKIGIRKQ